MYIADCCVQHVNEAPYVYTVESFSCVHFKKQMDDKLKEKLWLCYAVGSIYICWRVLGPPAPLEGRVTENQYKVTLL